ncbi:hypothetical protein [Roseobacter sp.]|uniref:hypothetical protein n=1 Tax=Roseobacter sp. TaxID=1907202 RepID=UPI0029670526|nr:hypothetical protein [Roseobacter sp.]MDW3183998.1 hypothetical protein [Roseobacter sp.]
MCVRKANGMRMRAMAEQPVNEAADRLMCLLSELPVSERSGCALGLASRLIEFAAFEMAGTYSADDVADLINCAARVDHASSDVQTTLPSEHIQAPRRLQ